MLSRSRCTSRRALPSSTTAQAISHRWTRSNVSTFKALHHNCFGGIAELDALMRIQVDDVKLFFDVEGAKLRTDRSAMRQVPTLLLLHGGPGFDHSGFKPAFTENGRK
jgi:hypothetical protein